MYPKRSQDRRRNEEPQKSPDPITTWVARTSSATKQGQNAPKLAPPPPLKPLHGLSNRFRNIYLDETTLAVPPMATV